MKTFRILADCTIQANCIDDVFDELSFHFQCLADGSGSMLELETGSIEICPVGDEAQKDLFK